MTTPEDRHYDKLADAQADHDAMIDAIQHRGVDRSFPLDYDCEPTRANMQYDGGRWVRG